MSVEHLHKLHSRNFNLKHLNTVPINNATTACYKPSVKPANSRKENKPMNETDRSFTESSFCCLCLSGCRRTYKECVAHKHKSPLPPGPDTIDEMDESILSLEHVC